MKTILIVDDEPELCELFEYDLTSKGYNVITANGGNEGFDTFKMKETDIDLVVSDIRMPKGDGIEFLQNIRSINQDVPVILLTGFADVNEEEVKSMGAFCLLNKPIRAKQLSAEIEQALSY